MSSGVVIIGGGFIGLETAATIAGFGKRVTVLEAGDRLLARAVSPVVSSHVLSRLSAAASRCVSRRKLARFEVIVP